MNKTYILAAAFALSTAFAADFSGTWKLNLSKSKYVGMAAPKEQTVTYTAKGTGWEYAGKGISATGEPIRTSFTYLKDGIPLKATGFPYWDEMIMTNGTAAKSTTSLRRQGKDVGTASRSLAADGKSMIIEGKLKMPDGKDATYLAYYEKQ